jgi:hypothetical protein
MGYILYNLNYKTNTVIIIINLIISMDLRGPGG